MNRLRTLYRYGRMRAQTETKKNALLVPQMGVTELQLRISWQTPLLALNPLWRTVPITLGYEAFIEEVLV